MPRVNPERMMVAERNLAVRIAHEREQRGWKQATLARRMKDVGCPMEGSTIYKIESGDPPRRVAVDELVGFARVFGIPVEELLLPLDLVMDRSALVLTKDVQRVLASLAENVRQMIDLKSKIVQLQSKLAAGDRVARRVQEWLPSLMLSRPMGDDDDSPDLVGAAWEALDRATTEYAEWLVANYGGR